MKANEEKGKRFYTEDAEERRRKIRDGNGVYCRGAEGAEKNETARRCGFHRGELGRSPSIVHSGISG
jgi:hypothetical protein